jgi:hypothetical protein
MANTLRHGDTFSECCPCDSFKRVDFRILASIELQASELKGDTVDSHVPPFIEGHFPSILFQ